MKRVCCIALAALMCACGRHTSDSRGSGSADGSAQTEQAQAAQSTSATTTGDSTAANEQTVALTGCLQGGESVNDVAGTSGREMAARSATGMDRNAAAAPGADTFMLVNAKPADAPGAPANAGNAASATDANGGSGSGVGRNGAGGSGGSLVSGVSSYVLEGNIAELRAQLNHQVTVTGRINARQTVADVPQTEAASRGAGTAGSSNNGTAGAGVGAPGGAPATATGGATTAGGSATRAGAAGATGSTTPARRIVVESVRTVSATCAEQR